MSDQPGPFGLTQEHRALQDVVRRFVDERVTPTVMDREANDEYPADLLPELADIGVLGMCIPEEYGGSDVDYIAYALVFEELARGWMGLASVVGSSTSGSYLIAQFGTPAQKSRYLPDLAAGRRVSGIALTEPEVGSDLKNVRMTARREGDVYIVNGTKTLITQARHASPLPTMVVTDPTVSPSHRGGMSLLLVEPGSPGYGVSRDIKKLGHRGLELCELVFDDAEVPADALLGGREGNGFQQMMSALDRGRIYMAAASTGIARACLEAAATYANQRVAFGAPIADHQAVQLRLARTATNVEASRLLTLSAAAKTQADGAARTETAMAKVFASEICVEAAMDAMRVHGGYGFTAEFPIERYYRDAALMPIGEGMNDILLFAVAADVLRKNRPV